MLKHNVISFKKEMDAKLKMNKNVLYQWEKLQSSTLY